MTNKSIGTYFVDGRGNSENFWKMPNMLVVVWRSRPDDETMNSPLYHTLSEMTKGSGIVKVLNPMEMPWADFKQNPLKCWLK